MGNVRFLKTRVDGEDIYMIMNKCNLCPYLMVDKDNYRAVCGNPVKKKEIDDTVNTDIMYYEKGDRVTVLDDCRIPDFCYLSKNLKDEFDKGTLKVKKNETLYIYSSERKGNEKILSEVYVCFNEEGGFTFSDKFNKYLEAREKYNEKKLEKEKNTTQNVISKETELFTHTTIIIGDICSCCGEKKESVDRNTNDGMCNECNEKSKTNYDLVYNSYINNFRLKRKKEFIEKNFKKIL